MPARKKLPPVIPRPRKKAPVVKLVTRDRIVDGAWGPTCPWPRAIRGRNVTTLPVIRIERY
jgi:hypothetical protein